MQHCCILHMYHKQLMLQHRSVCRVAPAAKTQMWTPGARRLLFAAGRLGSMWVLRTLSTEQHTSTAHLMPKWLYAADRWQQSSSAQRQRIVRTYAATTGAHSSP